MDFKERLNWYINKIGCNGRRLAEASSLSPAAVSRYRTGERAPNPNGRSVRRLAEGIELLSEQGSGARFDADDVRDDLIKAINGIEIAFDDFLENLSILLEAASVSNNELARALNFDPSYISRIRARKRRPADLRVFMTGTARYIAGLPLSPETSEALSDALGTNWAELSGKRQRERAIATWLKSNQPGKGGPND